LRVNRSSTQAANKNKERANTNEIIAGGFARRSFVFFPFHKLKFAPAKNFIKKKPPRRRLVPAPPARGFHPCPGRNLCRNAFQNIFQLRPAFILFRRGKQERHSPCGRPPCRSYGAIDFNETDNYKYVAPNGAVSPSTRI